MAWALHSLCQPSAKSALTHHPQAGGGTAFGSRALSEGMRPLRGPTGNGCGHSRCAWNRAVRRPAPYASEKLPPAAFHCLRGMLDEGRETKDGGNKNWQFIIWKQRLSAGVQAVPLLRQRPT